MAEDQRNVITRAAIDVGACVGGPNDAPTKCGTLLTLDALGAETWIQIFAGTVNMTYPFADDPLERLRIASLRVPLGTELLEWEPTSFATFTVTTVLPSELAYFVDRLFVLILGCDDASYEVRVMIETFDP